MLSSVFYKYKRFREGLNIINYCLFSRTQDRIYVNVANSLVEQTVFKQMKKTLGLMHTFKYLMIGNSCFQYPLCLSRTLINGESLHIPPVVYSYRLQFLCFYHLEDHRGKHNALDNIDLTINDRFLNFSENFSTLIHFFVNQNLFIVKSLIWYE